MRRLAALLTLLTGIASAQASRPQQLFQEAVAAQQRGDDKTAIQKYQELLKLRPGVLEVRANLGAALARLGRFDEAIEQYRAALAKAGGNAALRFNLALAYYKKGALPEAVKELESVRAGLPDDLRVAMLLGDCHARLGQDQKVIALLAPLESAHPGEPALAWMLGSALVRTGRRRDGLERVEKAAKRGNSAEAYLLAGQTALKLNEFERARDDADAAWRLNSKFPGVATLRGMVLPYLGDNAGATAALRQAIEDDPKDFEAHLHLGAVLHTERDLEGARKHLERARELNPSSTLALYEMARLERTEGKLEDAVRDFEKVIRDDPKWAQPHIELSALYFRLNREAEGERERATFDRLNAVPPR